MVIPTSMFSFQVAYTTHSTQTRSRSLPHIADTKLAKYQFYELSLSSLSADVLQWSAWEFVDMLHPYLHFDGSHINYKIIDWNFRLICLIYTKKSFPINWKALSYAAEKIRTPDTLVRSQVLYPAELRPHLCCVSQQMIFYRSFN